MHADPLDMELVGFGPCSAEVRVGHLERDKSNAPLPRRNALLKKEPRRAFLKKELRADTRTRPDLLIHSRLPTTVVSA